jgi:K(+)-stimulated pyrophosphate-energized sodium pump
MSAFLAEAHRHAPGATAGSSVGFRPDAPEVYFAALLGVVLVAWFASRCLAGVARVARRLIDEVRRQLRSRPTSLARASRPSDAGRRDPAAVRGAKAFVPDHENFVENALRSSLREMFAPALVAAAAPIVVGLALRLARTEDNRAVAADSVAAFVVAGTVAGVLGSLLLGNAGGAWDNAKKYIVTGAHGGRYLVDETGDRAENPTYAAAAVGDSVGDALKDAVGPALLVLAKMLNVITLVFLPFFL